jgi:hypothetical protein
MLSIDVNNFTDFQAFPPNTFGPPDYTGPPSWLYDVKIYYNGTLQYGINDLSGFVLYAPSPFLYPFGDPSNLTWDTIGLWTTNGAVFSPEPNVEIIDGSVSVSVTAVTYANPCFKEGSNILTDQGYRAVETLRTGDMIQTLSSGYQPIKYIGHHQMFHPAKQERNKDQLYQCSKEHYPELTDDLILTGAHSILVTGFKDEHEKNETIKLNGDIYITENRYRLPACVDQRTTVYETAGTYTIYHFALEHDDYYMNYGVYANGLLVETCSKRYMKELSGMTLLE